MTPTEPPPERWLVVLRALPADRPSITRLRGLLKAMLRRWRVRVESIMPILPPPPATQEEAHNAT